MAHVNIIHASAPDPTCKRVRVAAYARISETKGNTPQSLSAQVSYYQNLIQSTPGWDYAGVFYDAGATGTNTRRPGFQELIDKCRAGQVDLILTKSISRLSRNTVDLLDTVRMLKELGVEVRFERENISTFSGDGELMLSILASFAQEESWSTSANVKWGIRKGFERGITNQMCVYGYTWTGSEFIINEAQAQAVRYIYKRFLEDAPYATIIRECEALGFEAYWGGRFTTQALKMILRQQRYTGNAILGRWYNPYPGHHGARNDGQAPQYYVEGINPVIIDEDTWQKVQVLIDQRTKANSHCQHGVTLTVFHGKITCAPCGCNMNRCHHHRRADGERIYGWRCPRRVKKRPFLCEGGNIREDRIKQAVCLVAHTSEFTDELFTRTVDKIMMHKRGYFTLHTTSGRVYLVHFPRGKNNRPIQPSDISDITDTSMEGEAQ